MTLLYFVQRGRWAGYWRYVPLAGKIPGLHSRLTARGYMVREIPDAHSAAVTICPTCRAPHRGAACENPACPESGNVTRESWDAAVRDCAAALAEAGRFARLRAASFGPRREELP